MRRSVDRQLGPQLHARAAAMRAAPTSSEALLWEALRGSKLRVGFRRQVPIARYIVDFCAPAARLVAEVDGGYHQGRARADARRDRAPQALGYCVVRVSASDVVHDLPQAIAAIRRALAA
jgi:very-short-patch-repair endonuclease